MSFREIASPLERLTVQVLSLVGFKLTLRRLTHELKA